MNSIFLSFSGLGRSLFPRWGFGGRRTSVAGTNGASVLENLSTKTESSKDIKTLLEAARQSRSLQDLQEFLLAARNENLNIALVLKFHEIDLVNVVSGKIKRTQLNENVLKLRFDEFSSQDYEKARAVIDKVTHGQGRSFNPPYVVFLGNPIIEVSNQISNYYEVKGIHLILELLDNKIEIC